MNTTASSIQGPGIVRMKAQTGSGGRSSIRRLAIGLAVASGLATAAGAAEVEQVRIAASNGLVALPNYVVVEKKLIEKHAKAAGLDTKVELVRTGGGGASTDLLLSGNVEVAMAGWGHLANVWDRTRGDRIVRGIMALNDSPIFVVSNDPKIKALKDFGPDDRIGMATIKTSIYAIIMQMVAAKEFGWDNRYKYDALSVSVPAPESAAMLLSGRGEVRSAATVLPYNVQMTDSGKVHEVFRSSSVLGDHLNSLIMADQRFRNDNPKTYAAVVAAYEEAINYINANKADAASIYMKYEPQQAGVEWVKRILDDEGEVKFTSVPHGMGAFGDFMYKLGLIKKEPKSWKDFFWPEAQAKNGS